MLPTHNVCSSKIILSEHMTFREKKSQAKHLFGDKEEMIIVKFLRKRKGLGGGDLEGQQTLFSVAAA